MIDNQKFFRGQRVRLLGDTRTPEEIKKDAENFTFYLPSYNHYIATQHDCIIVGSYFDLFGKPQSQQNFNQYSVVVLSNPYNSISWIGEGEIELISDDRLEGERLIREAHKQYWGVK